MGTLNEWARSLKRQSLALYYAARDPRTPWYAKLIAAAIVAYALSPIDLIPDFIPVLGLLDDLLLLPAAIWIVVRLMPKGVLDDARERAEATLERPTSRTAAVVIVAIWIACAAALAWWAARWL
ncbi:MAG TPA: YkvA family protein [Burkholderiales bacterium]|nr:YkvA family protein [Burkholderiales bacterium]